MPSSLVSRARRLRTKKSDLVDELEKLEHRLAETYSAPTDVGSKLLLEAIEHLEEGLAVFDAEDRLVLCNKKYLSDFTEEFRLGMHLEDVVRAAVEKSYFATDGLSDEELVRQRLNAFETDKADHEMRLANGDWISIRHYKTPDGGTVLLRFDVSELKQAVERIRESEERLRSFAASANDAIISIDRNATVIAWNRGAERIFGYSEVEMVGQNLDLLIPDDLYSLHVAGVKRASVDGKHKYDDKPVEIRGLRKGGEEFPLEMSLSHWSIDGAYFFSGIIRDITEKKEADELLQLAKAETENLLLRVLPAEVVERMHKGEVNIADRFDEATVLFSDLVGFTKISALLSPQKLVENLNALFSRFDALAAANGVEKVKTIGDAYMAVGGVPKYFEGHAEAMADMALSMLVAVEEINTGIDPKFQIRIGLQTGPVVAGIIGEHRFLYDIWGDTVNMAARFESYSEPGRIHISTEMADILEPKFELESRGNMDIRGKGKVHSYFLNGRKR